MQFPHPVQREQRNCQHHADIEHELADEEARVRRMVSKRVHDATQLCAPCLPRPGAVSGGA